MRSEGGRPDGTIDFTGYSTEQLRDLEYTLDRHSRPLDFAHLLAEIERRDGAAAPPDSGGAGWAIEFTRQSGLRGWLRAKAMRLRLYGSVGTSCRSSSASIRRRTSRPCATPSIWTRHGFRTTCRSIRR